MKKYIGLILAFSIVSLSSQAIFQKEDFKVYTIQTNIHVSVNVSNDCEFSGTNRDEKSISFYSTCHGFEKSITVEDNGAITNFVIKNVSQREPMRLEYMESSGFDWKKLNTYYTNNNNN